MDQIQYEIIKKVIQNGAPALANELCSALDNLVNGYNEAINEVEELKAELTKRDECCDEPSEDCDKAG